MALTDTGTVWTSSECLRAVTTTSTRASLLDAWATLSADWANADCKGQQRLDSATPRLTARRRKDTRKEGKDILTDIIFPQPPYNVGPTLSAVSSGNIGEPCQKISQTCHVRGVSRSDQHFAPDVTASRYIMA